MFFRLFNWLVKRVPYTLALMLLCVIWASLAAVFAGSIIFVRISFETPESSKAFIYAESILVLLGFLIVLLKYGLWKRRFEEKRLKILNDNILNGDIHSDISTPELLKTFEDLKKINVWTGEWFLKIASIAILGTGLAEWLVTGNLKNVFIISIGGIIGIAMGFIFVLILSELLTIPARRKCKILLTQRGEQFEEPPFLSLRIKSKFFIFLIGLALFIILALVYPFNPVIVVFAVSALLIAGLLSELVFDSIYKTFVEIKESAKELTEGKRATFFSGSLDKEILDLSQSLNESAEEIYESRKKIEDQLDELQRWHKATIGRELKMIELKKEIKEKKERIKELEKK